MFQKRQMEGVFDGKGDSTSGRGCTSGVQRAKAQPGEEVVPWRRGGRGGGGEKGGGGVGLKAVSKTQRYLAANSSALPESWQRVPYLLDNTQLK